MLLKELIVAPPHTVGEGSIVIQLNGDEINCIEAALRHLAREKPIREHIIILSEKWTRLCSYVQDGEL